MCRCDQTDEGGAHDDGIDMGVRGERPADAVLIPKPPRTFDDLPHTFDEREYRLIKMSLLTGDTCSERCIDVGSVLSLVIFSIRSALIEGAATMTEVIPYLSQAALRPSSASKGRSGMMSPSAPDSLCQGHERLYADPVCEVCIGHDEHRDLRVQCLQISDRLHPLRYPVPLSKGPRSTPSVSQARLPRGH